jgi:hypothetical protein
LTKKLKSEFEVSQYDFLERKNLRFAQRGTVSMDIGEAKRNLEDLQSVFSEIGIQFFLLYGTLLGAVRDGQLIPHDTDIDIGIFREFEDLLCDGLKKMQSMNFIVIRMSMNKDQEVDFISIMRNEEYIDIAIFESKKKRFRNLCGYGNNWHPMKSFTGFENAKIGDRSYLIPRYSIKLLKLWYGKNWNIPKENQRGNTLSLFERKVKYVCCFSNKFILRLKPKFYIYKKYDT